MQEKVSGLTCNSGYYAEYYGHFFATLGQNPTSPPARRQTAASARRVTTVWRGLRSTLASEKYGNRTKANEACCLH